MTDHICCETVRTSGLSFYRGRLCGKRAKVEIDGKHYCGTHDPTKVNARIEARDAKWASEFAANAKKFALNAMAPAMLDALRQWQAAERDGDAEEMANARASRDAVIAKVEGRA